MATVAFETAHGLPKAPCGQRLRRVRYTSCPQGDLCLHLLRDVDARAAFDEYGMRPDSWWTVRCTKLPDRTMRLFQGSHSMRHLLKRYGFLDGTGCVNHKQAVAEYEPQETPLPPCALDDVPQHLHDASGVPQFHPNSGVCWFGTLCWTSFANAEVREWLCTFMPTPLATAARGSLFSRDAALEFRKKLWFDYGVGDEWGQDPALDGRNGFTEFSVLCAKLGVPLLRFREQGGTMVPLAPELVDRRGGACRTRAPRSKTERHLLALRYQDGAHSTRFPVMRRIEHQNRRYRLLGIYNGARHCGHQNGMACPSTSWRHLSWGDSDLHKDGIGPIYAAFEGDHYRGQGKSAAWWEAMREITHLTKFGYNYSQICNMNAWNLPDQHYDQYRAASRHGSLSLDVLYYYDGT